MWQISVRDGEKTVEIGADRSGTPRIDQRLAEGRRGLRMVWEKVGAQSVRVEVEVRLGEQGTSLGRWEISIAKPQAVRITHVRFRGCRGSGRCARRCLRCR